MKQGKFSLVSYIKNLRRYNFLMEQLVSRDFKTKYKRSVLGVFWSFLNPLMMMAVQYAVFSRIMKLSSNIEHYAVFLLTGIVLFNGFNDCCNQSMRAIVGNAQLITKVYVPKFIYPASKVFSASINILLSMIPLLLVALLNGIMPSFALILLPIGLILFIIFILGMGFLLSSLMVFFRDIEFLWGVFSTMWMYATPIIYDLDLLWDWMQKLELLNPLYHYITFMRTIIIGRAFPSVAEFLWCAGFSFAFFAIGSVVFHKTQDYFIFHI